MKTLTKAAVLAVAALGATPALAAPVPVSGTVPVAKANIVRPLVLTASSDLNFGTIILGSYASTQTVTVSQGGALVGCGTSGLTCQGATSAANYLVKGTNNAVVTVAAPNVTITNANNAAQTLTVVLNAPATVNLGANGNSTGAPFSIGGSLDVPVGAGDGLYAGTMAVTVDYQ
ncbi:DUF4402 domain-containing protein [Sphingomonas ginkgonis]|nr:DUF4402 domain-containing protein [Sphingomonas ginkgonis]